MTSTCGQNGGSKFEKSLTGKLIRYASNQEYIFFFEVPAPRQMTSQNYPPGLGGQIPITEFCYEVFFIRFKNPIQIKIVENWMFWTWQSLPNSQIHDHNRSVQDEDQKTKSRTGLRPKENVISWTNWSLDLAVRGSMIQKANIMMIICRKYPKHCIYSRQYKLFAEKVFKVSIQNSSQTVWLLESYHFERVAPFLTFSRDLK